MFRMTPDHNGFQETARDYLAQRAALSTTADTPSAAEIRAWWRAADEELGLTHALLPEDVGGLGLDFGYTAVLLEESGRCLLDSPLLPVVVGIHALDRCGDEARRELQGALADGSQLVGMAIGSYDGPSSGLRASAAGGTVTLSGHLETVLHGGCLDILLVPAADESGELGLYAVRSAGPGVEATELPGIDLRRRVTSLTFTDAGAELLPLRGEARDALVHVSHLRDIALAIEQLGAAERAMEMAVEYARTRQQFGRAIGSFQSIKHRCAEMLIHVERARCATYSAITAILAGDDLTEAAALAQAVASEALDWVAYENVQVHGGIGFTWEHQAHLYARRATSARVLFGTPARHRERLIAHLAAS